MLKIAGWMILSCNMVLKPSSAQSIVRVRITSYNVCYTKLLRYNRPGISQIAHETRELSHLRTALPASRLFAGFKFGVEGDHRIAIVNGIK